MIPPITHFYGQPLPIRRVTQKQIRKIPADRIINHTWGIRPDTLLVYLTLDDGDIIYYYQRPNI